MSRIITPGMSESDGSSAARKRDLARRSITPGEAGILAAAVACGSSRDALSLQAAEVLPRRGSISNDHVRKRSNTLDDGESAADFGPRTSTSPSRAEHETGISEQVTTTADDLTELMSVRRLSLDDPNTVSYTHLTLPTICSV